MLARAIVCLFQADPKQVWLLLNMVSLQLPKSTGYQLRKRRAAHLESRVSYEVWCPMSIVGSGTRVMLAAHLEVFFVVRPCTTSRNLTRLLEGGFLLECLFCLFLFVSRFLFPRRFFWDVQPNATLTPVHSAVQDLK